MARVYAADDFGAIRARMAEIRRERSEVSAKQIDCGGEVAPVRLHTTQARRLLKDLVINRRLRGGRIVVSLAKF